MTTNAELRSLFSPSINYEIQRKNKVWAYVEEARHYILLAANAGRTKWLHYINKEHEENDFPGIVAEIHEGVKMLFPEIRITDVESFEKYTLAYLYSWD
jgi:hypothetical protein